MDSPRRGLIRFDIAGNIPAGATITGVQLTLFLGQVAGTDHDRTGPELNRLSRRARRQELQRMPVRGTILLTQQDWDVSI
jgi:hypothetical protein